jgi:hypothetical protein
MVGKKRWPPIASSMPYRRSQSRTASRWSPATGARVAARVGRQLGVDQVSADQTPADKLEVVRSAPTPRCARS